MLPPMGRSVTISNDVTVTTAHFARKGCGAVGMDKPLTNRKLTRSRLSAWPSLSLAGMILGLLSPGCVPPPSPQTAQQTPQPSAVPRKTVPRPPPADRSPPPQATAPQASQGPPVPPADRSVLTGRADQFQRSRCFSRRPARPKISSTTARINRISANISAELYVLCANDKR
jgi:hypothetical protein